MKRLNIRKRIVSWDEEDTVEGTLVQFLDDPFEIAGIEVESETGDREIIYKPIGYSNLQILREIPVGSKVKIVRGLRKKNKKTGREFFEFAVYVPDDMDVKGLSDDIPF